MNPFSKSQKGFTLPELMVAILLGTIITGAVLGMYLSTSRNFSQDERYALMQENGRYALRVLAEDLTMADFWGKMTANDTIPTQALPFAIAGICAAGAPGATLAASNGPDLFNGATGLLFNNPSNTPKFQLNNPTCAAVYANQQPNTSVLVIKRVNGIPENYDFVARDCDRTVAGLPGVTRFRTNGAGQGHFVNDTSSPPAGYCDWRYMPRIYFVRDFFNAGGDGIPSLCRMDIVDNSPGDGSTGPTDSIGAPALGSLTNFPSPGDGIVDAATCIAEGVEHFHIQFGIDTDGDGVANRYNSSPVMVPVTGADMEGVVSARIYLLARSSDADPAYTDNKSFALGDLCLPNPADCTATNGDNFYRRVFSTTVMVRNSVNLNLLNN